MSASPHPGPLQSYPRRRRVAGDLRRWRDVELPGLGRRSDILVWLPPGYDRARTASYPVIYLHDGANLFDRRTSFAGATWQAGEALMGLHHKGIDAIAVGVPCSPTRRIEEYTPWLGERVRAQQPALGEPAGDAYVDFLTDHLKPWIDTTLRTRPEREHTVVAGSSMGGVISLHAWLRRPDVFGGIGAFSSAFWVPGEAHLQALEAAVAAPHPPTRFYLDVGGREIPEDPFVQTAYIKDTARVAAALHAAGATLRFTYDSAAHHFETAWAERLPAALRWLLDGYAVTPPGEHAPRERGLTRLISRARAAAADRGARQTPR